MEKYKSYLHFLSAKIYKDFRRYQMSKLIYWDNLAPTPTKSGRMAITARCSRIPYLLPINFDCLWSYRWDVELSALPQGFREKSL